LKKVGHLLFGCVLMNVKEPASLHVWLMQSSDGLLLGAIARNSTLESSIERKGSGRSKTE